MEQQWKQRLEVEKGRGVEAEGERTEMIKKGECEVRGWEESENNEG